MALADTSGAIGAVTRLLQDHLLRRGFDVSIGKPEDAAASDTNAKLNLFLYEAGFEPQLRNQPLHENEAPPLWLVLKYLLTAFDTSENSDTAAAHDLLGRGITALNALARLPIDALVAPAVRLALDPNPEPLKLSFDEASTDLLSRIMQGTDERFRLSVAFQVRPVMIASAVVPRGALLVGVDYTREPATIIGREGVQIEVIPSLGPRIERIEPELFEAGATLELSGSDLGDPAVEAVLGDVVLTVLDRGPNRLLVRAEGKTGTPIASGSAISAGVRPLGVRRRRSPTRVLSGNLLPARLQPTLNSAALVGGDLRLAGTLLGSDHDDVIVLVHRVGDDITVRMFDSATRAADQKTLVIAGAATGTSAGDYRVILRVNDQQAKASPSVTVP